MMNKLIIFALMSLVALLVLSCADTKGNGEDDENGDNGDTGDDSRDGEDGDDGNENDDGDGNTGDGDGNNDDEDGDNNGDKDTDDKGEDDKGDGDTSGEDGDGEDGEDGGKTDDDGKPVCEYDGEVYTEGESFTCSDGCNTCTCEVDGSVSATEMACDGVITCAYNGKIYNVGDVFMDEDDCNSCSCEEDGGIACENADCDVDDEGWCGYNGRPIEPGETFLADDGCNWCTCVDGVLECEELDCSNVCTYNGVTYQVGESFDAADGCNTCTCDANLEVACTEMACDNSVCAEGKSYFEPGCGGTDDMPVITAGCYQSCQGSSCKSGVCQTTDINPCICDEDMVCCAACGSHEWLCLDEPDTCVKFDYARPTIVTMGVSYGGCLGDCNFDITFGEATGDSCMTATLKVCDNGVDAACPRENTGTLTPLGHAKVTGLAAELQGVTLEEVYGCPGCADGGIGAFTFSFDGSEKSLTYDHEAPPEVLKSVDAFNRGIVDALNTCTANDDIQPASNCTPQTL